MLFCEEGEGSLSFLDCKMGQTLRGVVCLTVRAVVGSWATPTVFPLVVSPAGRRVPPKGLPISNYILVLFFTRILPWIWGSVAFIIPVISLKVSGAVRGLPVMTTTGITPSHAVVYMFKTRSMSFSNFQPSFFIQLVMYSFPAQMRLNLT